MKIGEIQNKVISQPNWNKDDGLFEINICPCCGKDCGEATPHSYSEAGIIYEKFYRKSTLSCEECGASFSKKILDRKVPHNTMYICFNISALTAVCSPILGVILMCFNLKILSGICFLLMISFAILALVFDCLRTD